MNNKKNIFWSLLKLLLPFWRSEEKWRAWGLLLLICAFGALEVRIQLALNVWQKEFYNALQVFDKAVLLHSVLKFLGLFVILFLSFGYMVYFNGVLANRLRRWMTQYYLEKWLNSNNVSYTMQVFKKNLDNIDQRISEDINDFSIQTVSLFSGLFNTILSFIFFSIVLWHLSGSFTFMLHKSEISIPGYMLWAGLIYAVLGTWIVTKIGARLVKLNYQQQQFNADFRFNLVRARESVEQIAMYKGEGAEKNHLKNSFSFIFGNYMQIITVEKYFSFFRNGYTAATFVLGSVLALPKYFAEKMQLGGLMQINGAFGAVIVALSYFINTYMTLATWRSVIQRLTELNEMLEESENDVTQKKIIVAQSSDSAMRAQNLDLHLPNGISLLSQFNCCIFPGEKILITGNSGVGKSTLLRALAGIWPFGAGEISLPKGSKKLFLPQKSYLPFDNLCELLAYPHLNNDFSSRDFCWALEMVGLSRLAKQIDQPTSWAHELSVGEQQLIVLARIFLQKPNLIFMDEVTSALDETTEKEIYLKIFQLLPQAIIISISHRSSLKQFFTREINLNTLMWIVDKRAAMENLCDI